MGFSVKWFSVYNLFHGIDIEGHDRSSNYAIMGLPVKLFSVYILYHGIISTARCHPGATALISFELERLL
jgi:hypothetical protein